MGSESRSHAESDREPQREGSTDEPVAAGHVRAQGERAAAEIRRLELLYRLSRLLTRFESVKRDVAAVLTLVSETLALRTAVVLLVGDGGEPARTSIWHAEGVSLERQQAAIEHLQRTYAQLDRLSRVDELEPTGANVLGGPVAPVADESAERFVVLPLVVAREPIFGAVQLEGVTPLDEGDLKFVNTVVNQLAVAIDRHRAIEARHALAEAARLEAERGRAHAEALQRRFLALVDNLSHAFVWEAASPGGELLFVSKRAEALLGYEDWRGRDLFERVHAEDCAELERTLAEVLADGTDRSVEHRTIAQDGRTRWFQTGVHLAVSDDQEARWQGVSVDITPAREAAARVAEQLEFTRALTASLGEGVLAVNRDMRVSFLNPRAESMLGVTQRACGAPLDDVLTIERADGTALAGKRSPLARVVRTGKRLRSDARLFAGPGTTPIPVSYTSAPLRRDGEVTGAVLVFRDLLEVRRAEREQRFLADAGELLLDGSLEVRTSLSRLVRSAVPLLADVCIVDEMCEDGSVVRIDAVFADPAKQHLAERMLRSAPSPDWPSPQRDALRTGKPSLIEEVSVEAITRDEEHAALLRESGMRSMMSVPLSARGRVLGVLTFGLAESGRRYGARDLALAGEIARRAAITVESARLYQHARRATEARDELLAIVSHDLRSPLGTILMGAQLLLLDETLDPSELRRIVGRITRAAERASALVTDLLDLASIESGRFTVELSGQELAPLLEETIETNLPAASRAGLALELDPLPAAPIGVRCDRARVVQVLGNLIGNAIKFTQRGGRISVRAELRASDALVCVTDTGSGISPEALTHIFDRYWQVQRTGRTGAGLGLAIVHGLVQAHGGAVWAESSAGVGSTFCFTLPLCVPPGAGQDG